MADIILTNKTVEDLSKIWDYTFEVWTGNHADRYYEILISCCEEIANNPELGRNYEGISRGLFGLKSNRHIIFYRTLNANNVEITRILHERMDLKKRLNE